MRFENIRGDEPWPLEITLLNGAPVFRLASLSLSAYAPPGRTKKPGMRIVGYIHEKDDCSVSLVWDRLPKSEPVLGRCTIYKEAIHSIRQLGPS